MIFDQIQATAILLTVYLALLLIVAHITCGYKHRLDRLISQMFILAWVTSLGMLLYRVWR